MAARQAVGRFNQRSRTTEPIRYDLHGIDLVEVDFARFALIGANLTRAALAGDFPAADGLLYDDLTEWPEGFSHPRRDGAGEVRLLGRTSPVVSVVAGVRHYLVGDQTGLQGLETVTEPRWREIRVLSEAPDPGTERARERLGGRHRPPEPRHRPSLSRQPASSGQRHVALKLTGG